MRCAARVSCCNLAARSPRRVAIVKKLEVSALVKRTYRVCARVMVGVVLAAGRARGGGRASPDGRPGRPRLPEGADRRGGRRAGQRHHARCRPHFPGMGRARRADTAGLHRAALHQWPEPGDRHGAQGRAHLRSAQCLPGHAAADLDHHRAADHRSGDRPRRRHAAPHLLRFELAVAGRGGGDPGRAAAGRAQLQVADRPARHGPHRAGEAHAARHQDGHHLGRPGGARPAPARRGGRQHFGRCAFQQRRRADRCRADRRLCARPQPLLGRRQCRRPQALDVRRPVARCGAAARPRHRAVRPAAHRRRRQGRCAQRRHRRHRRQRPGDACPACCRRRTRSSR